MNKALAANNVRVFYPGGGRPVEVGTYTPSELKEALKSARTHNIKSPAIDAVERRLQGFTSAPGDAPSGALPRSAAVAEETAAKAAAPVAEEAATTAAGKAASRSVARAVLPGAAKALGLAAQFFIPSSGDIGSNDQTVYDKKLPLAYTPSPQGGYDMRPFEPVKPVMTMRVPRLEQNPVNPMQGRIVMQDMPVTEPETTPQRMLRQTPQNGLNTGTSIVDLLKSRGQASDYSSRANMAAALGIDNYRGTAEQNTELMRRSQQSAPITEPETTPQRMLRENQVPTMRNALPSDMLPRQQLPAPRRMPQNEPLTPIIEARFSPPPKILQAPMRQQGAPAAAPVQQPSPETVKIRKSTDVYQPYFIEANKTHGVDEDLLRAVLWHESRGNVAAKSGKGATGLMQIMPATFKAMGGTNITDPKDNIVTGAKYLAQMLKRYGGNEELALAAYNAGPARVKDRVPDIKETKNYVTNVMAAYRALKGQQQQI